MTPEPTTLLTIVLMAAITYATRLAGPWLLDRLPPSPRLTAALRQLPGAILVSLVAPAALASGPFSTAIAALVILVAVRTGRTLLPAVLGTVLVATSRVFLPS